ncbi:MAG TPA: hypothetical protein VKE96_05410 [Vicinamibacterales bacterium]|nr:hypothetical protein [Vicinamibacterales bacterium]
MKRTIATLEIVLAATVAALPPGSSYRHPRRCCIGGPTCIWKPSSPPWFKNL